MLTVYRTTRSSDIHSFAVSFCVGKENVYCTTFQRVCHIFRYITAEQKKTEEFAITEDDVSEIRQDINKFRLV